MKQTMVLDATVFIFKLLFGLHLTSLSGLFIEGHCIGDSSCGIETLHCW